MDDLISRQAVLNTLENVDKFLDEERTVEKYKELLTECIKVLLTAENNKVADVLDKISAEIDEKISHYEHFSGSNTANGLMIAKKIIGKYKAESEE